MARRTTSSFWRYLLASSLPLIMLACNDQCGGDNVWLTDGGGDGDADADGEPTGCVDLDGDGYGRNCARGTDCDDGDPERHANCTVVDFGEGTDNPWDPRDDNSNGVIVDEDGSVGKYTSIALDSEGNVHISYFDDSNNDLKYAANTTGSWQTFIVDEDGSVGEYTSIRGTDHEFKKEGVPILEQGSWSKDIVIEDDVWLGSRVMIMPGITIGSHSIVAASAVVTKSVPPNSVAKGIPAKISEIKREQ